MELRLQPGIITSGKALERQTAGLSKLVNVVLEGLVAKEAAPLGAECEGRLQCRQFQGGGWSLVERDTLVPTLDCSDVSQDGPN